MQNCNRPLKIMNKKSRPSVSCFAAMIKCTYLVERYCAKLDDGQIGDWPADTRKDLLGSIQRFFRVLSRKNSGCQSGVKEMLLSKKLTSLTRELVTISRYRTGILGAVELGARSKKLMISSKRLTNSK